MLESIMHWLLGIVQYYGLAGLLISSFLISTIFVPFSVEVTFPILLGAGFSKLSILLAATLGSVGGTLVNYYIGYKGVGLFQKQIKKEELDKAAYLMNKYGWIGLLAVISMPFLSVDPLTVLCGITRMDIKEFTIIVVVGKLVKYAIVLGVVEVVFHLI